MASEDTLFVCLLCQERIKNKPPVHSCQKECHRESGLHHDFCPRCRQGTVEYLERLLEAK
jgi:hypothetical protein